MKFLDWFSGKGAAVAEPPAHKQAAERAIPAGQIVGVHGFGSLQEPDLRHDCPYCHHVLTENGSKGPRLRFDTIEATGKTAMSCPHCKHEITLADLKQQPEVPLQPSEASAVTGKESITLRVKDEQTARNVCGDQYFLFGVLKSDSSPQAQRFLAALQRGGTYRYEVRRDRASGECEVKMWMK